MGVVIWPDEGSHRASKEGRTGQVVYMTVWIDPPIGGITAAGWIDR